MADTNLNLDHYWMPFTANRSFKKNPRMVGARGACSTTRPKTNRSWTARRAYGAVNAGHAREPIIQAIQAQARDLDYAPSFQYGHPVGLRRLCPRSRRWRRATLIGCSSPIPVRRPSTAP
jgi:adenosylmethionine-8-amino-7-oxononanoate aminotransferase